MTMAHNGLAKLIEECGEVAQIAGKLLAYPNGNHPDGKGNLVERLQDELGDLEAAIQFICEAKGLDRRWAIQKRYEQKLVTFRAWHADPNN
ncbi:MAG: hypothetical protein J0H69_17150 [Burkholderiales bacterium]|nr:hypothetical protein [Burkholderiales bacterium]